MTALTKIIFINGIPVGSLLPIIGIFIISLYLLLSSIFEIKKAKQIRDFGKVYNAQVLSMRPCHKNTIYMTVMYIDNMGNKKMTEVTSYKKVYISGQMKGFVQVIEFGSETYEYNYAPATHKGVAGIIFALMLLGTCVYMLKDSMI